MVKATLPIADSLRKQASARKGFDLDEQELLGWQKEGVVLGMKELRDALARSSKEMQTRLRL